MSYRSARLCPLARRGLRGLLSSARNVQICAAVESFLLSAYDPDSCADGSLGLASDGALGILSDGQVEASGAVGAVAAVALTMSAKPFYTTGTPVYELGQTQVVDKLLSYIWTIILSHTLNQHRKLVLASTR